MPKLASVEWMIADYFSRLCFSRLEQTLIRDNWRCVVTGILESSAPDDIIAQIDFTRETVTVQHTECGHIIPESTFFGVDPESDDNLKVRG